MFPQEQDNWAKTGDWSAQHTHRWYRECHRAPWSPLLDSPSLTLWWLCHAWWLGWVSVLPYHTKALRKRLQRLHYWKTETFKSVNGKPNFVRLKLFIHHVKTHSFYLIGRRLSCHTKQPCFDFEGPLNTLHCFNLKSYSQPWNIQSLCKIGRNKRGKTTLQPN